MFTPTIIILAIVAIAILFIISIYNKIVALTVRVSEAWSDIEVQLKRRYDLIPNLIETVKGYANYEKETLEKVIQARNSAMNANGIHDKSIAENELSGTLKSIFALSENYPDLKANQNFLELQRELTNTEDRILSSRRFYNTNVRDLNITLDQFPGNIFGNLFKFSKKEFFELSENEQAAKDPIKVSF